MTRRYRDPEVLGLMHLKLSSLRVLSVGLLIFAISISPRINFGTLGSGRSIDLRYEDILIVVIMILWFFHHMLTRRGIYLSPIFKPIFIYLSIAIISSCIGIIVWGIDPAMTFFFISKEIQYIVIFIIVANFIVKYSELSKIINVLLICSLIAGAYGLYQFVSGVFIGDAHGYYGIASIGELSSFATGGYFAIMMIISAAIFFYSNTRFIKYTSTVASILSCFALILSGSRANVVGAAFATLILLLIIMTESRKIISYKFRILVLAVIILSIGSTYLFVEKTTTIARVTDINHMRESFIYRAVEIYPKVWNEFKKSPIIGQGKTACSLVIGGTGEAHNHYLRILAEMGVIGLLSFLFMLLAIMKMSIKVYKNRKSDLGRAIGLSCLLCTISLMVAAIVQDAFIPVKVDEMFWLLVGLTVAVNRLNIKNSICDRHSNPVVS